MAQKEYKMIKMFMTPNQRFSYIQTASCTVFFLYYQSALFHKGNSPIESIYKYSLKINSIIDHSHLLYFCFPITVVPLSIYRIFENIAHFFKKKHCALV